VKKKSSNPFRCIRQSFLLNEEKTELVYKSWKITLPAGFRFTGGDGNTFSFHKKEGNITGIVIVTKQVKLRRGTDILIDTKNQPQATAVEGFSIQRAV
jgi:hypothetical protein